MKIIFFLLAILLVALDQLTKLLAYEYLVIGTSVDINAFFSLSFARNYGAAFSFLEGEPSAFFAFRGVNCHQS
jgi:signal peptidase II